MAAEGEEIAVHRLHVDLEVRSTLGTIHQDRDAMLVSRLDDLLHGIHRSQDIADMRHADDLRPLRDVCFDVIATNQTSIIRYRQMLHHNPPLHRLQLPRDNVRMMFHLGDNHLVARLHLTFAERTRHEVDSLCGTTGEDNLLNLPGVDKPSHLFAGCLMEVRCLLRQIMHSAMHIRIHIQILVTHGIEHTQRLLGGGSIIEIHQWLAIHLTRQNGKVLANLIYIITQFHLGCKVTTFSTMNCRVGVIKS